MERTPSIAAWIVLGFVAAEAPSLRGEELPPQPPSFAHADLLRAEAAAQGGFSTWAFGYSKTRDKAHQQVQRLLARQLAAIDFVCQLRPDQMRHLELMVKGDLQRLFEEVDRLAIEHLKIASDPAKDRAFRQRNASLPERLRKGPRGEDSLFVKAIEKTLTPAQAARYAPLADIVHRGGEVRLVEQAREEGLSIDAGGTSIGDPELARIAELPKIRRLLLANTKVSDEGLARFPRSPDLWSLVLTSTAVTDAGLANLRGFPNLQTLILDQTQATDATLAEIAPLKHLVRLSLERTGFTDAGLVHLRGLAELRVLHLDRTQVTDEGLRSLAGLTTLDYLGLAETRVTDAGLPHLRPLTHLVQLYLDGTQVTDAGLHELVGLQELGTLGLLRTRVTPRGVSELQTVLPAAFISVRR